VLGPDPARFAAAGVRVLKGFDEPQQVFEISLG
jgi:hypothetical protein